jgi:hypothetical protein
VSDPHPSCDCANTTRNTPLSGGIGEGEGEGRADPGTGTPTVKIHLRSLYTNEPHPLASNPILYLYETDAPSHSIKSQIMGDTLGILFSQWGDTPTLLGVWKWTTGEMISVRSITTLPLPFHGFAESCYIVFCVLRICGCCVIYLRLGPCVCSPFARL